MPHSKTILPVILAGGSGQRLWPVSLPHRPKPFVGLLPDQPTLFQQALARAHAIARAAKPLIVCAKSHGDIVQSQLGPSAVSILLEPEPRDTAPAICAAALWAVRLHGPDCTLAIMPADHHIGDHPQFIDDIDTAVAAAVMGHVVTLAIPPTRAATEFGYMQLPASSAEGFCEVDAFIEKPIQDKAEKLLHDGNNFWNAGMFIARADALIAAFEAFELDSLQAVAKALPTGEWEAIVSLAQQAFGAARKTSFDYAIMERLAHVRAVKARFSWRDLGTWAALHEVHIKTPDGVACLGPVTCTSCANVYVRSNDVPLTVDNCRDAVIVADNGFVLALRLSAASHLRGLDKGRRFGILPGETGRIELAWCGGTACIWNNGISELVVVQHD